MKTLYGEFSDKAFVKYKKKLHNKIFWLMLYKDPKTSKRYKYVNYDKYFETLMKQLNGLQVLLLNPEQLIELQCILQAAHRQTRIKPFNYGEYRKFILDAHTQIDRLWEVDSQ